MKGVEETDDLWIVEAWNDKSSDGLTLFSNLTKTRDFKNSRALVLFRLTSVSWSPARVLKFTPISV